MRWEGNNYPSKGWDLRAQKREPKQIPCGDDKYGDDKWADDKRKC
jgi:hypothetical protein